MLSTLTVLTLWEKMTANPDNKNILHATKQQPRLNFCSKYNEIILLN